MASNQKSEGTLFSSTFKIEKTKCLQIIRGLMAEMGGWHIVLGHFIDLTNILTFPKYL